MFVYLAQLSVPMSAIASLLSPPSLPIVPVYTVWGRVRTVCVPTYGSYDMTVKPWFSITLSHCKPVKAGHVRNVKRFTFTLTDVVHLTSTLEYVVPAAKGTFPSTVLKSIGRIVVVLFPSLSVPIIKLAPPLVKLPLKSMDIVYPVKVMSRP